MIRTFEQAGSESGQKCTGLHYCQFVTTVYIILAGFQNIDLRISYIEETINKEKKIMPKKLIEMMFLLMGRFYDFLSYGSRAYRPCRIVCIFA
jgi:hypothetical protein